MTVRRYTRSDLRLRGVELRPIPGVSRYEAGSDGEIYSFCMAGGCSDKARKLSASPDGSGDGRRRVHIHGHDGVSRLVAVLVCSAFHGPRPEGADCSHLDGDRTNDVPENLRWETRAENESRKRKHGTVARGRRNGAAKLQDVQVREIKRLYRRGLSQSELARVAGVSRSTMQSLLKGETWGHVESCKEDGDVG